MSSITDAHPILPCLNWEETITFYDKLGFALGNLFPDLPDPSSRRHSAAFLEV
jgi:catechol 2,3-dioxygenase-like lactoylglutathione lyase family enzyme